jgi:response regulator RpfG family c-di-GMP phosphodiesterase
MSITDVRQLFVRIQKTPRENEAVLRQRRQRFVELLLKSASGFGRKMASLRLEDQRRKFVTERFAGFINLAKKLKTQPQIRTFLTLLLDTVRAYDYTIDEHQKRVADGCLKVARELENRGKIVDRNNLWMAARLHDFGKIGWPKEFLAKPPPLQPADLLLIETHLYLTLYLMESIRAMRSGARILIYNHAYDGYPTVDKLEIMPLDGQILSAVDCFDALISPRPYRKGRKYAPVDAFEKLTERSYDADLLEVILDVLVWD